MWFLLVRSNMDPHYYKPQGNTFWFESTLLQTIGNHILVWIHITTNQMEPHFGVNPHYYKPEGTTFCCKCGSLWFVVIWVHMTTNQREPHFGVHSYYYKPEGITFWCKCGSLLVCSNMDPHYNKLKETTFCCESILLQTKRNHILL